MLAPERFVLYALWLAIVVVPLVATVVAVRRWLANRRSPSWLVCAVLLATVSTTAVQVIFGAASRAVEQAVIAGEYGIDLRTSPYANGFPTTYLLSRLTKGETRRQDVRALMNRAKARYSCRGGRAEKYLFLSANYSDAQVANIYYDERGVVSAKEMIDSADSEPLADCTAF